MTIKIKKASIPVVIAVFITVMCLTLSLIPSKAYADAYDIGDVGPAGGLIFYIDGSTYYEAALTSLGGQWSSTVGLIGGTGTEVGSGENNTNRIVNYTGADNNAAKRCADYSYNDFDDWFLPSLDELSWVYQNIYHAGLFNFYNLTFYWSSSERDENNANTFIFPSGGTDYAHKTVTAVGGTIPVRAFEIKGDNKADEEEESQPWVRDRQMTCWQVWVNQDNAFEFVFFWEYYNNNHVQIYDMAGSLVWETDFPKGQAHFIADLPDGMYTVKTFHEAGHILQEFVINKP